MTFTVEQPTTELPHGRVRLYVNGVLSRTSLKSGKFIKDMPDVNQAQLGATKRGNKTVWASNLQVRNLTVYDRALKLMKFKHEVNYLKEVNWNRNFLREQKSLRKKTYLKVVGTINQIKMVSRVIVSQLFSRQIKER